MKISNIPLSPLLSPLILKNFSYPRILLSSKIKFPLHKRVAEGEEEAAMSTLCLFKYHYHACFTSQDFIMYSCFNCGYLIAS